MMFWSCAVKKFIHWSIVVYSVAVIHDKVQTTFKIVLELSSKNALELKYILGVFLFRGPELSLRLFWQEQLKAKLFEKKEDQTTQSNDHLCGSHQTKCTC